MTHEYHQRFTTLRKKGILEGGLIYNTDIVQSFVILSALPQKWNKETKHTCICRSFFKHGACEHCASMAMLMDRKVKIPKNAVLKKLQHRQRRGKEPTTSVTKDEGLAFRRTSAPISYRQYEPS